MSYSSFPQADWGHPSLPPSVPIRATGSICREQEGQTRTIRMGLIRMRLAERIGTLVDRFRWFGSLLGTAWQWCLGCLTLVVGLAVLATIPGLQLLSVGYLLEAGSRVSRTGSLRSGLIGVPKAARAGSLMLGVLMLSLPLWLALSLRASAIWIDPGSPAAIGWTVAVWALGLMAAWVVAGATLRGGRIRHFLWPRLIHGLRQAFRADAYQRARDAVWEAVSQLRLPYYFWLGLRGVVGGVLWLVIPITLLVVGDRQPLLGVLGGAMLVPVIIYLPFLQIRMAAENRLGAMFEIRPIRQAYLHAPLAFLLALWMTLLLALPLYLLKIELIPQEAAWLPSLLFVVSIFPARVASGWALARASRRDLPRHWCLRWLGRGGLLPVAVAYVGFIYLTRLVSWYGVWSLYEQHAFLVPAPFLGMFG